MQNEETKAKELKMNFLPFLAKESPLLQLWDEFCPLDI